MEGNIDICINSKCQYQHIRMVLVKTNVDIYHTWPQRNPIFYTIKLGISKLLGWLLPFGPSLTNTFSAFYEKQRLKYCQIKIKPIYYRHYLNDICALFKLSVHLLHFWIYNNSKHSIMSFLFQTKSNSKMNFSPHTNYL